METKILSQLNWIFLGLLLCTITCRHLSAWTFAPIKFNCVWRYCLACKMEPAIFWGHSDQHNMLTFLNTNTNPVYFLIKCCVKIIPFVSHFRRQLPLSSRVSPSLADFLSRAQSWDNPVNAALKATVISIGEGTPNVWSPGVIVLVPGSKR